MAKQWIIITFGLSFIFLANLKSLELRTLTPYFRGYKSIRLKNFEVAKKQLAKSEIELLELWESMLTGRTAPVSRWMKERYQLLGLNHLFTPSGFHLSAVLNPFMWIFKKREAQIAILIVIGFFLSVQPGQGALKRMVLIKGSQKVLGQQIGFLLALFIDVLFGSFQGNPLSFSYSILFLGIIYSGYRGFTIILWFFCAQIMLSYFQGNHISPLLLVLSPLSNFAFGLAMPLLFLLALPLWNWQMTLGVWILKMLQVLVDLSVQLVKSSPLIEVNLMILILIGLLLYKRRKTFTLLLIMFCSSLNSDLQKRPTLGTYDFIPQGSLLKSECKIDKDTYYFSDGKCERQLVRGFWWEKCSPRRKSTYKIKKLSYL
jgi:hypothetical protein